MESFTEKRKSTSAAIKSRWLDDLIREPFAGAWQRNLEINPTIVLSFHAVFSCISLIASDISKMPLRLMRRDSNDIWKENNSGIVSIKVTEYSNEHLASSL